MAESKKLTPSVATQGASKATNDESCPCGTQKNLSECCLPVVKGKREPLTAEELMRARYTAFVLGEVPFIISSHHSKTRDQVKEEEIKDWSLTSKWLGLTLLQVDGGKEHDTQGAVYFNAKYVKDGKECNHAEKGLFEKENGKWKFYDAEGLHLGTYRRAEPKTGRNDACPCGSGKKYKKCCQLSPQAV